MGDPGLYSKFVEMQQEQAFAPRDAFVPVNPYVEGLRLDRARILEQLSRATNRKHVAILRRSLKAVESKMK